jgi:hypothetical protein
MVTLGFERNRDVSPIIPHFTFHRLLRYGLRYKLQTVSGGSMKDPYVVLEQKEQDMEWVSREIQALLIVIPLLIDNEPNSDDAMHLLRLDSAGLARKPSGDDTAALETYYPWIRHMRESEVSD